MKLKIFSILSILLLSVSALFAQDAASKTEPFQLGLAVTDITPPLSYPMAGYYSIRLSEGTLDPLMLRAFCFKQGDEMCVLAISDSIYVYDDVTAEVKRRIQEKTGLSGDAVFLVGTHTHTGPVWMKYDRKITPEENLAAAARNDHETFNYKAFWVEQTEKAILDNLKALRRGKTTILIAHRVSTVAGMDKILFMDDGELVAIGTHDELYESCEAYRMTVELQKLDEEGGSDNA